MKNAIGMTTLTASVTGPKHFEQSKACSVSYTPGAGRGAGPRLRVSTAQHSSGGAVNVQLPLLL